MQQRILFRTLTVLATVIAAKNWQTFADCRSDHERICCAETVLVWLGQGELLKIEPQLANVACLFNGHLAGLCAILSSRVVWVNEGGLILACCSTASELELWWDRIDTNK